VLVAHIDDHVGDFGLDEEIYAAKVDFSDVEDALRDTSLHVVVSARHT